MFQKRHLKHFMLLASITLVACAAYSPSKAPAPAPVERRGVSLYLPLEDNTVLAYETSNAEQQKGFFAVQVTRKPGSLVELKVGQKSQLLQMSAQEARHVSGGLLLKWPLTPGDTFPGEFAPVQVIATDRAIEVPAGRFTACVETLEATTEGAVLQQSRKIFCPNVGLVFFENQVARGAEVNSQTASLRSFGPKVDVFAEPAPAP